jgi:GTP cyclohydrolase I
MVRGFAELLTPPPFDPTTFPNDEGYHDLVLSRRLPVRSVCEHHLLPFVGVAHIGYLPGGVGVFIEAEHTCMTLRGVHAAGFASVTSTVLGALRDDARSRQEFFALARGSG